MIPFLQDRDPTFYLTYLEKLIPLKFKVGTIILKKGVRPEEVFMILSGEALNITTNRIFSVGSMIGELDIVNKGRDRL